MSFVNPKISSMDHDSNDYADGSTGSGITMQFDYEGVVYSTDKKKIDEDEAAEFGLDISSYGNLPKEEIDRLGDGIEKDPDTQRGLRNPSGISPSGTGGILGGASILNKIPTNLGGRVAAGRRLLAGSGVSFGTGTFGTLGGDARTLVAGTSAAGKVPSPDLFQKAEGASKKINKFGEFVSPSNSEDLINAPEVSNSGIDSTKVNQAASQFQEDQSVVEQTVGPGQTVVSNSSQSGFSKSYGTGAALAKNEGIISKIAEPTSKLTNESADADAALSKLPDGSQQLTEKGSAIMNALRKPNSAVGVRRPLNLWTDPDKIDSNRRNLNAEKGISNPLDD